MADAKAVRVARIRAHGGPEAIAIEEVPLRAPAAREALVRVLAAGVNFIDVYHRTGVYSIELPFALGQEGAGVIEAVGPDAQGLAAGDRVAWASVPGSYASHVVAPVEKLVPVPDQVDARTAAAAMLQGMTAQYLARATFPLGPEHTCLVHAAAGGVGLLLCQLAKRAGARVIGTAGTREKAELARAHGADECVVYTEEDFRVAVQRLTGGRGVDVVYDSVGKSTWEGSLGSLRPRGMMVSFGNASGAVPPIQPLVLMQRGSLYLTRPTLGHYTATRAELLERAGDVLGAIASGALRVHVHAALPLESAGDAQRMLESRGTTGKLLLVP